MKEMLTMNLLIDQVEVPVHFAKDTVENVFLPLLRRLTAMHEETGRRIIVFLGAPIASGKSVLLDYLARLAKETPGIGNVQSLGLDGFHFPNAYLDSHGIDVNGVHYEPMRRIKGWPETFNVEKVYDMLSRIRAGEDVNCPHYDRRSHDPKDDQIPITGDIILVEGLWMMYNEGRWADVQKLADYRIMLLSRMENLRSRAVARKIKNGCTPDEALEFFNRSDVAATRRIVTHMADADLWLESLEDNDIVALPGCPSDLTPYYE